jgi:hypothetical protein
MKKLLFGFLMLLSFHVKGQQNDNDRNYWTIDSTGVHYIWHIRNMPIDTLYNLRDFDSTWIMNPNGYDSMPVIDNWLTFNPFNPDTTRVLLVLADTSLDTDHSIFWDFGYEVSARRIGESTIYLNSKKQRIPAGYFIIEAMYLNEQ